MSTDNLKEEAKAFNARLSERISNDFVPDLQNYKDNDFFYKSFWRKKTYADMYVGVMSQTYIDQFNHYLRPNSRILDFGCGPGYFSLELARAGYNVIAYDIADTCISTASNYLHSLDEALLSDRLRYTSNLDDLNQYQFDGVLCSGVLHHLKDVGSTVAYLKGLMRDDPASILVFHEPNHKSWTRNDAFIVSIIRSILASSNLWYEPISVRNDNDLSSLVESVFHEYVYERDPSEKNGQSPNDLSCDYDEICAVLRKNFSSVKTWPSRAFIYRCLGGLRSDIVGHEDLIAKLLECIDSYGVSQGFLNSNYMYGVATQPILS